MQVADVIKAVAPPVLVSLFTAILVWLVRKRLLAGRLLHYYSDCSIVSLWFIFVMLNKSLRREASYRRASVS